MLADTDMGGGQMSNFGPFPRKCGRNVASMATGAHEGRRLKAALALADMTTAELAEQVESELHIGLRTIERVMQGQRNLKPWEREAIARALDVPEWFLERGLATNGRSSDDVDAVDALEEVARALTELAQRVSQNADHRRGAADA